MTRKTGTERFHGKGAPASLSVLDFWQWSGSDLLGNAQRGVLAEFLVASALGLAGADGAAPFRREWDAVDLETPEGLTLEVKSAAYLQAWPQAKPSTIRFGIAKRRPWFAKTDTWSEVPTRSAQLYVFALLAEQDKARVDPLDLDQWRFYVVPTRTLDAELGDQKTLGLNRLEQLQPRPVGFGQLKAAIENLG